MHPNPLLRMTQQHLLEGGIVRSGIEANCFARVITFDDGNGSSKRITWVPSGSRQLEAGITGAPVSKARTARLLNVPAGCPRKSTVTPSELSACWSKT